MSRYFNQSRPSFTRSDSLGTGKQADLKRTLQEVARVNLVAEEPLETRLSGCQRLRFPEISQGPLILSRTEVPTVALESYRVLRTRLLRLQATQALRSVILTSAVGGEGKTLTTMNLALCCSRLHDFPVLAIDADLRTSGLSRLLGDPQGLGLSNVLAGNTDYQDAISSTDYPNLYTMAAGSCSIPASELYSGSQWKDLMDWCSQTFRLILVDSTPVLPVADFEQIVSACDGVLVVVRPRRTPRELLKKLAGRVDLKKTVGVVFNGVSSSAMSRYASDYYLGAYTAPPAVNSETEQVVSEDGQS
jgi:protein-tyrosine kinase